MEEPREAGSPRARAILVTGAAGLVGSHVCRELGRRGFRVRALVRNPVKAAARLADTPAELRTGDIRDPLALADALAGAGSVIHLAAIAIERGRDTYESVNTDSTHAVLEAAAKAGARRFVFMSQNGASADSPSSFLRSKGAAELLVRESGLDWTVFRPSVIFGPEDEFVNVLARLVKVTPLVLPLPDGGRARFQPVAVRDLAAAVAATLERDQTIRGVYHIGGPEALSLREIAARVLQAMGAKRAVIGIPRSLLRPVVGLLQRLLPRPPVTTTLLDLLARDNVVGDNALEREFGVRPTPCAPEQLRYLRQLTFREAVAAFFK